MSDTPSAPMGEAVEPTQAIDAAGKQFQGKDAVAKSPNEKQEIDFSKMTGAEAKAYVEAQKKKPNPVKEAAKQTADKFKAADALAPATTEEVKEIARKMRLKEKDGQEFEVDEDEVKRTYLERKEHQRAANKTLQEGLAARKQAEEFIGMMKDPEKFWDAARKMGYDDKQIREMSEKRLAGYLEDEMMDPRDKELRDAKLRLRQMEDMEREQKETLDRQRHEALKKKYAAEYTTQFTEALKESQLPPTKETVAQMAKYIQRSAKIGFQMTAKEAAQLVREDLQLLLQRITGQADGETLISILGEKIPNKIREFDTKKLKSPEQHLRTPEVQGEPRKRETTHKRMTPREWREYNRK